MKKLRQTNNNSRLLPRTKLRRVLVLMKYDRLEMKNSETQKFSSVYYVKVFRFSLLLALGGSE